MSLASDAATSLTQREPALVEAHEHLVEGLLAEVRYCEQLVRRALDQLADGVDLGTLQAVARPLGQVEVLDRKVKVGRAARRGAGLSELEPVTLFGQLGNEREQAAQRLAS